VSVLNAFLSTWSNARQTFGEGTPQPGAQYDASGALRQAQSTVESAAPGSKWTGGAANAYGAANTEHGRVLGQLAGLDQRLSAHVDESAQVVSAGRRDLDAVRKWVVDAAASAPQGQAGEQMRLAIVQKGIAQVQEIIQRSNGELNAIGGKIRGLDGEYQALGDQKFANREGPQFLGSEGKKDEEEEKRRQAEKDVHDALAGDQEAAKRVEEALKGIKPGQPLSAEQGSYLSQMQAQQNGMSVEALKTAEQRLGDQKHIIADSWQLMSNDDVSFPKTETKVGALDNPSTTAKGGFDQLPRSVQDSLQHAGQYAHQDNTTYLKNTHNLNDIAGIVKDGNPALQTGTELDRGMMRAADTVMDRYDTIDTKAEAAEAAQNIFAASGRDHQIVYDHLLGTHGDNGDDFLHDINRIAWTDDGKAASSLFSWTNESHTGPEATIAAETAEKYATYVGSHKPELMGIDGQTVGQLNPELVKGYAHGLTPYMGDIAGLSTANPHDAFGPLDIQHPEERPLAKGLFSVLSTQEDAYREFHGAANAHVVTESHQWAEDVKNGVAVSDHDPRMVDCATLKALETVGTTEAARALGLNAEQVYQQQKSAYDLGVKLASGYGSLVPGVGPVLDKSIDIYGNAMASSILGPHPDISSPTIANMGAEESARFAINALVADGVPVHGVDPEWFTNVPVDPNHPELGTLSQVQTLEELQIQRGVSQSGMQEELTRALDAAVGRDFSPADAIASQYNNVIKNPEPNEPGK
jgi:EspA/EspE family